MTTTTVQTVNNKEIISSGLVESASVNSIADFIPSKLNKKEVVAEQEKNDFIDTFICHFIFYAFFCISIVMHIMIDFGLGSLIKKTLIQLMEIVNNYFVEKNPSFVLSSTKQ